LVKINARSPPLVNQIGKETDGMEVRRERKRLLDIRGSRLVDIDGQQKQKEANRTLALWIFS
jgi:hypothetical protein